MKQLVRSTAPALAAVAVASFIAVKATTLRDSGEMIHRQADELSASVVSFQGALGYGGFIHAFKNAILRPGEPQYLLSARSHLATVQREIDTIARISTEMNRNYDLSASRATLKLYEAAVDTVAAAVAIGTDAREIDSAVRIDDSGALESIAAIVLDMQNVLDERARNVARAIDALGIMVITLAVLIYVGVGWRLLAAIRDFRLRHAQLTE